MLNKAVEAVFVLSISNHTPSIQYSPLMKNTALLLLALAVASLTLSACQSKSEPAPAPAPTGGGYYSGK